MRVLHIGKYYPPFAGGIEHFLADLLPALQRRGIAGAAVVHDEQRGREREQRAASERHRLVETTHLHGDGAQHQQQRDHQQSTRRAYLHPLARAHRAVGEQAGEDWW